MSWPLVRYVLTAALRDRLILVCVLSLVIGASLSLFLGSAALTEKAQFVQVFAASGLRLAGLLCLVLFVVAYIRRSFETRDIDYLLSRPLGRMTFMISHALAFSLLAVIVAAAVSFAALGIVPKSFGAGHILWAASLAVEYVIMANTAFFFAMVLPGVASGAMAVTGLYVLARLMGELLGIAAAHPDLPGAAFFSGVMNLVSMFIPRLDLMAQSVWLVYGPDGTAGLGFALGQGVVFTALVVLAACVDLVRRKF